MAFAPIFNAQNFMLRGGETCGMGQINPHMKDLDVPSINFNTTINLNGGFGCFGKANFGSGLMGGFSGTGFGIGGWFGGGRMTARSFLGGLLGRTLNTAMSFGTLLAMRKIGGGYGGYRGGYGGSIFGDGYGAGYGGTGLMLDSCYLDSSRAFGGTTIKAPAGKTTAGTTTAGTTTTTTTPAAGTPASGKTTAESTNTSNSTTKKQGAGATNSNGSGNVKDKGSRLFQAVTDKDEDGKTEKIFAGRFDNIDSSKILEQGATLKKGDDKRDKWNKGQVSNASLDDYKNAVRLGVATGSVTDADKADNKTGAPQYFTMTDYRSGNEYTFKLIQNNEGKIQYKLDIDHSNLAHDDKGINGHNWEFAEGAETLVFDVEVNEGDSEIKLSYNGNKVSTNNLVVEKKKTT